MKIPRELLLILAPLVIATVATTLLAPERAAPPPPDLASDSAAPGGSRALYLWLQSLGYHVERMEYRRFRPDESTNVLFILAPTMQPSKEDLSALRRWVERGGTLIIAGDDPLPFPELPAGALFPGANALPTVLAEFGLTLKPLEATKAEVSPSQPLLLRPVVSTARVEATRYISSTTSSVPYLGEPERPISTGLTVGKGQVYVLASVHAFSNQGLGQADNAALLLNWLPAPHEAGAVAFDEVHHGRAEARSLLYVMVHEPWGWAVLYAAGIAFLYLLIDGRRFGRAVPRIVDTRRLAAEHVVSLAGLLRRGDKRDWVAQHYERALRRQLANACGLDPTLDTPALAAQLGLVGQVVNGLGGQEASRALLELSDAASHEISEVRLVRLIAEADRIINACSGRRR